jgi:hypothetical protein
LASQEEKDAWQAMRVGRAIESGQASVADLPEAYGGRPQGTTRRAIRQQLAWDAQQAAAIQQQQEARQVEEFNKTMLSRDLDIQIKEYDFKTKKEDDLFEKNEETKIKASEADLAEFANTLDPTDPTSASRLAAYIENNPYLLNSTLAAKRYDYFAKAASNSVRVIEGQQNKAVDDAVSAALRAGLTEADIANFKTLNQQGGETYDIGGLRRATDTVIGKRVIAAEKDKEPKDPRTELQKAQDQLDDSKARLGAYIEEGEPVDDESESYRKVLADVNEAQARVDRLGKAKPKTKKEPKEEETQTPIQSVLKASGFKDAKQLLETINELTKETEIALAMPRGDVRDSKLKAIEKSEKGVAALRALDAYKINGEDVTNIDYLISALQAEIKGGGQKFKEGAILVQGNRRFRVTNGEPIEIKD